VAPEGRVMRVWKIIAGERSKHWRKFVSQQIAAINAGEEGDLYGYTNEKEFLEHTKNYSQLNKCKKKNNLANNEAWNLYSNVQIGDLLLLYGQGKILALGYITGKYTYYDCFRWEGEKYFHRRKAKWKIIDTSKKNISPRLKKNLKKLETNLQEINEKEDLLEILDIAANQLFNTTIMHD
jgi:predicted Mrr-cat superfamily restriction endonuclease